MELCFEISSIIILLVLMITVGNSYSTGTLTEKIFSLCMKFAFIGIILSLIGYSLINKQLNEFNSVISVIILLSQICYVILVYLFTSHSYELVYQEVTIHKKSFALLAIPALIAIVIIITNPIHKWLFTVADGSFVDIGWRYGILFFNILYGVINIIFCAIGKKRTHQRTITILYIVPMLPAVFCIIQLWLNKMSLLGISYTVVILMLYLYIENKIVTVDCLTDLPNKDTFLKKLENKLVQKCSMNIIMVSIENFKLVNEKFGCDNADRFIQEISSYLKEMVPKNTLFRHSGVEFVIILDRKRKINIEKLVNDIQLRFEKPFEVNEKVNCIMTAYICVAGCPELADNVEDISTIITSSLAELKRDGNNKIIFCDKSHKTKIERRKRIINNIKTIAEEKQLEVFFQPLYNTESGTYRKFEALFRLNDKELGEISPSEFFPIAEETGYVIEIGYITIEKACEFINKFKEKGINDISVSVNFSKQQLLSENASTIICQILEEYGVSKEQILLEVSENEINSNYDLVSSVVDKFHKSGINFILDDFGNGFSNISKMLKLNFSSVKLNGNMLRQASTNEDMYLLVSALIAVFDERGVMITGKNIETDEVKNVADLLFIEYLQGYYFCKPLRGQEILDFVINGK